MEDFNEIIIKSIFKKLNIDCLILSQKDSVDYDKEDCWVNHKLRKKIFALKNTKVSLVELNSLKDSLPEKVYNYILAESLAKDSKELLKSPREILMDMWKNFRPDLDDELFDDDCGNDERNERNGAMEFISYWIFLYLENNELKIKYSVRDVKRSGWNNEEEKTPDIISIRTSEDDLKYQEKTNLIISEEELKNPMWEKICCKDNWIKY
jgi:hypothetical protein